ncbi:trehalose-phosphatase [Marinitenerispora sediminis]|uniref:Trehalose 6-phosphate phosphatase n=1 Tax=Marinitenerispora sediminis TaxID=1931232 RepID=A0A368T3X6_9ACTN|nr:trehalose-phosphatase [Marinitenerispora sediminis]RCV54865.1 trehalose-phosphatase [Marinitenerispora sediminis]RCV57404.1 trehalose-phosphatase [Marinitenerispora sediminis]RCV60266.1 trehalose-phosphatase [Marinitenerispora sediminis]
MTLPRPRTPEGAAALDRLLADPSGAVLAFDFDGTLAPIVPDPRDARAYPGAAAVLARLSPLVGGIAIVTGRPAAVAVEYGGFDGGAVPGLTVLGQYGRERWADGRLTVPEPPPGVAAARAELPRLLERLAAPQGTWIEDKEHALAVHTRRTADPDGALDLLREPLAGLAGRAGLALEPGRMVIELRPPGMDKGVALTGLVAERGATSLLYAGDDLGDLAAFDAVRELRDTGVAGLTVCSGSDEVAELADRADLVVDGPAGVVGLLTELAAALGG